MQGDSAVLVLCATLGLLYYRKEILVQTFPLYMDPLTCSMHYTLETHKLAHTKHTEAGMDRKIDETYERCIRQLSISILNYVWRKTRQTCYQLVNI